MGGTSGPRATNDFCAAARLQDRNNSCYGRARTLSTYGRRILALSRSVSRRVVSALRVLASYARTRARRFATRAALAAWQERQVRRHLARVLPRAPYHRDRFAPFGPDGWRAVPPVGKADVMAAFDAANTAGVRRAEALAVALAAERSRDFAPLLPGGIAVGLSSGTSGSRGLFLASAAERDAWAGALLARVLPGPLGERHTVAFFLRANSALYERLGGRRLAFRFHDLLDPLGHHVRRLNAERPTVLSAPPAMLRLLAAEARAGRLQIAPRRVVSVADVLEAADRAAVEAAFGGPVHEVYQATEGFLGFTCAHGTLHLHETHLVVERERIDARRFVPVVTDFTRTTQPVLRHRLDDVLVLRATPCPCGSVLTALDAVEGRADDVFLVEDARGRTVPVFADFLRRAAALGAPDAEEYAFRQTAPDRVEVALAVGPSERAGAEAGVAAELALLWARHGAPPPDLTFVGPPAPPAPGAKRRRVVRAFRLGTWP